MMPIRITLAIAACLFMFAACKKQDSKSGNSITLRNETGKGITVTFYKTRDDYKINRAEYAVTIPEGTDVDVSDKWITLPQHYFIDCYTDDFSMTNWGLNPDGTLMAETDVEKGTEISYSQENLKGNPYRELLMGDNSLSQRNLSAQDALEANSDFTFGQSVFTKLHSQQVQYPYSIILYRDFSAMVIRRYNTQSPLQANYDTYMHPQLKVPYVTIDKYTIFFYFDYQARTFRNYPTGYAVLYDPGADYAVVLRY